jgi:hypothetical protein
MLGVIILCVYVFLMLTSKQETTQATQSIDFATEIKKTKEREIALAKQRAWKQKGGNV